MAKCWNTVMALWVPKNVENLLSMWGTGSFSITNPLHGVIWLVLKCHCIPMQACVIPVPTFTVYFKTDSCSYNTFSVENKQHNEFPLHFQWISTPVFTMKQETVMQKNTENIQTHRKEQKGSVYSCFQSLHIRTHLAKILFLFLAALLFSSARGRNQP